MVLFLARIEMLKKWLVPCLLCATVITSVRAKLIQIVKINAHIKLDIRYATKNNFTGKKVYPSAKCYLQEKAALALSAAQKEFETLGFGLKVFDGYRPPSVQKRFWDILGERFPDPAERARYVAPPWRGSKHSTGMAVDVTLIDVKTGKELEMPSAFDDFSDKAHRNYKKMASAKVVENCKLLETVMGKHGFVGCPTEWWHFNKKKEKLHVHRGG